MTVPNPIATLVLSLALLFLTRQLDRRNPDQALPCAVHNLLWMVTLLLVGTDLIQYRESSIAAWGVLAIGLLFFNLGSWVGADLARSRNGLAPQVESQPASSIALVGGREFGVLLVLYAIGFFSYLFVIQSRFGLATLLTNPVVIRAAPESYLASVPTPARLLLYVGPLLLALLVVKGGIDLHMKLWVRLALIATLSLSMLALLQRTNLFMGATWAIAAMLMSTRNRSPRVQTGSNTATNSGAARGLALVVAIGVGMLITFQIVGGALGKSGGGGSDGSGEVAPWLQSSGLVAPFRYLTTGVPAFLLLTESTNQASPPTDVGRVVYGDYNPQTWGAATFEPVAGLVPGLDPWNPVSAFVDVGVLTNVFTWLEPFYRDFRAPGVAIGAAFLGLMTTYLYSTRHWSPRRFWIAALFLSMVFLSTFASRFNATPYLFAILLVTLVTATSERRFRPDSVPALPGVR